ncbi:MAG: heavy metal-binding domain-containing protein [Bacteroidota bacterium]
MLNTKNCKKHPETSGVKSGFLSKKKPIILTAAFAFLLSTCNNSSTQKEQHNESEEMHEHPSDSMHHHNAADSMQHHEDDASHHEMSEATYQCPMHPEVTSDKPGKCPKCGMDLELKK